MNISVFAYTRQGMLTGEKTISAFPNDDINFYAPQRICSGKYQQINSPTECFYGERFLRSDLLIFIGSCGIAVRIIAPHLQNKGTDPAVLCADDMGRYVISLLSGHIGGANKFTEKLAETLSAQAIITTATDIHKRFSADAWAARQGFTIDNMALAKEISAAILERDIPFCCQLPFSEPLPDGLFPDNFGNIGVFVGWEKREPYEKTLRIIPKCLHLGIGCRRQTSEEKIQSIMENVLDQANIDIRAIKCAASVDLKSDEPGLLSFFRKTNIPINFYSADVLRAVPGEFSHSDFVEKTTGVDNVCERAAMIGADKLILSKKACDGVTIALAAELKEVTFE